MSDPARYDGSRPEPPYNTDTDAVALLQEELDTMTGDRDLFAKALAAMTADRDALRARLEITDDHEMPGDRIDHLEFLLESERKECGRLRAELDALRHEVELTNEHEHQIMQERNEARAELDRTKGEMEILREIVRLLDEAREHNRRRPRGAGGQPMGDEIDDLICRLYEIGAHPAMRTALERKADA